MGLTAFFDDSGTDDANPVLIVAGFGASIEQWDRFNVEWTDVLAEFEAPPFHAKQFDDARKGFGPYLAWSESKRRDYLNRLLGIIRRRASKSFATALNKASYNNVIAPDESLRRRFYSQFVFAAVNCIHAVCEWHDQYYSGKPIAFVFDEGNKNEEELLEVSRRAIIGDDRLIHDVCTADDKLMPPLQAADLLAFELCSERRTVATAPARETARYSRYPLLILNDHPHDWVFVDDEQLRSAVAKAV